MKLLPIATGLSTAVLSVNSRVTTMREAHPELFENEPEIPEDLTPNFSAEACNALAKTSNFDTADSALSNPGNTRLIITLDESEYAGTVYTEEDAQRLISLNARWWKDDVPNLEVITVVSHSVDDVSGDNLRIKHFNIKDVEGNDWSNFYYEEPFNPRGQTNYFDAVGCTANHYGQQNKNKNFFINLYNDDVIHMYRDGDEMFDIEGFADSSSVVAAEDMKTVLNWVKDYDGRHWKTNDRTPAKRFTDHFNMRYGKNKEE